MGGHVGEKIEKETQREIRHNSKQSFCKTKDYDRKGLLKTNCHNLGLGNVGMSSTIWHNVWRKKFAGNKAF